MMETDLIIQKLNQLASNKLLSAGWSEALDAAVKKIEEADLIKKLKQENKALRLLVEWAEESGFGFDQFEDEYEKYKDEIHNMKYIDGMIHVARRTLENCGELKND